MEFAYLTDIGRIKRQNEDRVFIHQDVPFYAVVADGMGGHNAGEVASKMAVEIISGELDKAPKNKFCDFEDKLRDAFVLANRKIFKYAEENLKMLGMGTTTVTAVISGGTLYIANVGDSRAYVIDSGGIRQISRDHSYVWILVERGEITKEQARKHPKRNYITRAMGTEKNVVVDTFCRRYSGEIVLLCTDGLTNFVDDEEILSAVVSEKTLQDAARRLVDLANERGGGDNITVALMGEKMSDKA